MWKKFESVCYISMDLHSKIPNFHLKMSKKRGKEKAAEAMARRCSVKNVSKHYEKLAVKELCRGMFSIKFQMNFAKFLKTLIL